MLVLTTDNKNGVRLSEDASLVVQRLACVGPLILLLHVPDSNAPLAVLRLGSYPRGFPHVAPVEAPHDDGRRHPDCLAFDDEGLTLRQGRGRRRRSDHGRWG